MWLVGVMHWRVGVLLVVVNVVEVVLQEVVGVEVELVQLVVIGNIVVLLGVGSIGVVSHVVVVEEELM